MPHLHTLQDLYKEYVFQRQHNIPQKQAVKVLREMRPDLGVAERQQLANLIRQWEADKSSAKAPQADALHADPAQQGGAAGLSDAQAPVPIAPLMPEFETISNAIECSECRSENPPDSKYCYKCGELLRIGSVASTEQLYFEDEDPSVFGKLSRLLVTVRGFEGNPVLLDVTDAPLVVGRSDDNSNLRPDVDLQAFSAKEKGVSRQHAILQRAKNTLTLTDNGSINHTFINGERVHPNEVRVIRDGDEVRFGQLVATFIFQRELRRLS